MAEGHICQNAIKVFSPYARGICALIPAYYCIHMCAAIYFMVDICVKAAKSLFICAP